MVKHYNDLIVSEILKDQGYVFQNPEFGKSNTDQSYYEPMASMIQNAQKSGSVSSSLHNDAEKSIADIRSNFDFLPNNMTQEEIQAMIVSQSENVKQSIESVNSQLQDIKDQINLGEFVEQDSTDSRE